MAVEVNPERGHHTSRPNLYVIDFTQPAVRVIDRARLHPQLVQLRRRRLARRLRHAGGAVTWAAGTVLLVLLALGGLAGLR